MCSSRCLLGPEIRDDPKVSSDFARLYHDLEGGISPIAYFFPYLPIPAHNRRDRARVEVTELFSKIIKARRQLDPDQKVINCLESWVDCIFLAG